MLDSLPDDLKPYETRLHRVVREGLELFQKKFGNQRAGMSITAERTNIHDCMVEVAQKVFEPNQCKRRGLLFLVVLGGYRIKLKKFDNRLVTSSYHTQAVFHFLAQTVQRLFDYDVVNLQLGYIPSGLTVAEHSIWITKPKANGKPEWEYELRPAESAALPITLPTTNPNLPAVVTRVKAKPAKFKKAEKGQKE